MRFRLSGSMEVGMKKKISGIIGALCLAVLIGAGLVPLPVQAAGGSISLSVSSSSVNIGDTITVTVNGSADVEALIQVNVSCSGGAEYTGSGNSGAILEPSAGGSDSATLTYRATSPGTVTFSAAVVQAYSVETADPLSVSDASASVTVKNEAGGGGASGGTGSGGTGSGGTGSGGNGGGSGGGSTAKSADNSLRSLSISPGTLSPAFQYSTLKYTASVAADVTSVAVAAEVSNAKAVVESVTGNTDLKPGDNTIKITVKAENGTVATYTIVVNRGGAASEEPEEPEEPGEEEPGQEAPQGDLMIGGRSYKVSPAFPEDIKLPEEFEKTSSSYGGEEVEAYNFFYGNLKLYYLKEAVAEGAEAGHDGCYFYDEASSTFFPYINIPVGSAYVIVLPASYNAGGSVPEGYEAAEVAVGENVVDGLRLSDLYAAGLEGAGDFYLVYGIHKNGLPGWYQYDSVEGSLQRFVQMQLLEQPQEEEGEPEPAFDEEKYKKEYQKLQEDYEEQKGRAQIMMCALVAVVVVAVVILVILLLSGRGKRRKRGAKDDQDIDFIDFDDL